jgi:hypothetical protein
LLLQKRINLTKTIRKLPIKDNLERAGYYVHDDLANQEVKYDSHEEWFKVSFNLVAMMFCIASTYNFQAGSTIYVLQQARKHLAL